MPQELQVLQCYSCKTFQVGIVKKEVKWSCKMCGKKQSIKKVFHRGNGKECRLYVQELNEKRIKSENETKSQPENNSFVITKIESENECSNKSKSKWFEFMENSGDMENTIFENYDGLSRGAKRKLDGVESSAGKKYVTKSDQNISAVEEDIVENLEEDLNQKGRIFIKKTTINGNEAIATENNVEGINCRKELQKLNNKNGGEPSKSKWDEFGEGGVYFVSNSTKDENLGNESNKKYERDKFVESHHKSRNELNHANIFQYETYNDINSFLEM